MSGTVIKKCGCNGSDAAKYQDRKYGQGMRVHNLDMKQTVAACTVCGKEQKA